MPRTTVNRAGGSNVENLRLRPQEEKLNPPGISVLLDVDPATAANQMRGVFGKRSSIGGRAGTQGSSTIDRIRETGFEVVNDLTNNFPNHGRLTRPKGVEGFSVENPSRLSGAFDDVGGL